MLGNLLKCKKLRAAEPSIVFAGATDSQRLDDVPEGVERHTHVGRMGHTRGVRGLFHDSTGARWRARAQTACRPSGARVWRRGGWRFVTHVDIVDYMGFNIS